MEGWQDEVDGGGGRMAGETGGKKEWMEGRKEGRMEGWMDGWMDGVMEYHIDMCAHILCVRVQGWCRKGHPGTTSAVPLLCSPISLVHCPYAASGW